MGIPSQRLDVDEAWERQICKDSVKPPLDAEINRLELPGSDGGLRGIIEGVAPQSLFVHESPGGCFRRIGSSRRRFPAEVLARLLQERSRSRIIRFGQTPIPGFAPEDLDPGLVGRFLAPEGRCRRPSSASFALLQTAKIMLLGSHGGGALLCCPSPTGWMPHGYVQAVSYVGEHLDVNYQIDAQDISGPLDIQIF